MNASVPPHPARAARRAVLAGVLVLGAFVCLHRLGTAPLVLWDEGRLAVSAVEMAERGDPLVARYGGAPDLWNTKPPLALWLMATSVAVLGPTEFALRLPSALAALGTALLLAAFGARRLRDPATGFAAAVVLLSTPGFVGEHVGRTADYDAVLVLWTTALGLAFFSAVEAAPGAARRRALWAAGAAFALAGLTKGPAALLPLPGLGLYALGRHRLGALLGTRAFWGALAAAVAVVVGYYGLREAASPGYLAAVAVNDLGRFGTVLDQHAAGPLFYAKLLWRDHLGRWAAVFPFAAAAGLGWAGSTRTRRAVAFALVVGGTYLVVVSAAQTKLPWYAAPFYPFAALVVGAGLVAAARRLAAWAWPARPARRRLAAAALVGAALAPAYGRVAVGHVHRRLGLLYEWTATAPERAYGPALDRAAHRSAGPVVVVDDDPFNSALHFYAHRARRAGRAVRVAPSAARLAPGTVALTCAAAARAALAARPSDTLDATPPCLTVRLRAAPTAP